MLYRKIAKLIENHLTSNSDKIMLIDGARQIGKTYIIRYVINKLYTNVIEINMLEDQLGNKLFENVKTINDFYLSISMIAGEKMKEKENTIIFIDEIQAYPHLLTMLKFLREDNRFTYIASGSLLGVTLSTTSSIPMGSIIVKRMYPLDFEEFLYANGFNQITIDILREKYNNKESLDLNLHNKLLDLFKKYLFIGGLPDAVNTFLSEYNIVKVREIQDEIYNYYKMDASKYSIEKKLKISRIYEMIPSNLENKKKRIIVKDIENIKGKRFNDYQDEFDYLINAGITVEVKAISNPVFPLIQSSTKNLLKLYLNDVGILSSILYKTNIKSIINDESNINLGTIYENVVSTELKAHNHNLFYYDNKSKGEVDFLVDDFENLTVLPIEVKSGKDYYIHSALNKIIENKDYDIKNGIVFSNEREIKEINNVIYLPIYFVMFI